MEKLIEEIRDGRDLELLLNHPEKNIRLGALKELVKSEEALEAAKAVSNDVNSHIHTSYSFSPYSPSAAVYRSRLAGLVTTGIMDHDSVGGVREFIEAGKIIGLPVTVGAELRVSFANTPLFGRKINNPDQDSVAYVAFHGIPHSQIDQVKDFFMPINEARGRRNRQMVERINVLLADTGISLDYDRDVLPISMAHEGGSVTERHLLYALSKNVLAQIDRGEKLVDFLENELSIKVAGKALDYLMDKENPIYEYDLVNVMKGHMVEKFYIPATDECVHVTEAARFAKENGIIFAYAYLGDVTQSVTGDKKAQVFEDSYLELLFSELSRLGFNAVTYMPSRNTPDQLARIRSFCQKHELFQISGEDINQPRQKFVCEAMRGPGFENLYDSAWALIGHELLASEDLDKGMFSDKTRAERPNLGSRVAYYRDRAKELQIKQSL